MYLKDANSVMEKFVDYCKQKDYDDLLPLLSRLYLECLYFNYFPLFYIPFKYQC